jgi:dienelactone hydrolase
MIQAPLMIHYAGSRRAHQRRLAGVRGRAHALTGSVYVMHMYEGANHGFHNDTTPRYDEAAARLAQERTITFSTSTCADRGAASTRPSAAGSALQDVATPSASSSFLRRSGSRTPWARGS